MDAPLPRCATTTRPSAIFGRDLAQASGDVLVGEAVESVATHPLGIERLGNRKAIGDLRMASVEGRIEAGNLQQVRLPLQDRADWAKIVGLVQRSERNEAFEPIDDRIADDGRLAVVRSAVHDAMADRGRQLSADLLRAGRR